MTLPNASAAAPARGALYDQVVAVLASGYYDTTFRQSKLPAIAARHRPLAQAAATAADERAAVRRLLAEVPASHLGLLSPYGRDMLVDDLFGRARPTLGMQLVHWRGRYYATLVLTGGAADRAGVRNWDQVVSIDGVAPGASPRLDWRTDDAHLPDARDPAVHAIVVRDGERVRLEVAARPGARRTVELIAAPDSPLAAASRSARVHTSGDRRIGYLHLWYVHMTGVPELLDAALDSALAGSEALVLDLRGRGGSGTVITQLLRMLEPGPEQRFAGPIVALIDRQARSGKEVFAYELRQRGLGRLVGEPTSGAVVPAAFADLGDAVLMYPPMRLPTYSDLLELKPTPPDVGVEWGGPFSGERDPILEAGLAEARRLIDTDGPGRVIQRGAAAPPAAETPLQAAPSLGALVEAMTAGYGGRPALERVRRLKASGAARIVDTPLEGRFEIEVGANAAYAFAMTLGAGIEMAQRRDARGEWIRVPGQSAYVPVGGSAAVPIRWQSMIAPPLQMLREFPDAAVEGVERFEGEPCVRVRLAGEGADAATLLVDASTGRASALRFRAPSPIGVLDATLRFSSYREVNGVWFAGVVTSEVGAQRTEARMETVEVE